MSTAQLLFAEEESKRFPKKSENQTACPLVGSGILYLDHPKDQPLCLVDWTSRDWNQLVTSLCFFSVASHKRWVISMHYVKRNVSSSNRATRRHTPFFTPHRNHACQKKLLRRAWKGRKKRKTILRQGHKILLMVQKSGDHQLRLVVYPIIYKVLYIPSDAGFLPSTVWFQIDKCHPPNAYPIIVPLWNGDPLSLWNAPDQTPFY